MALIASAMPTLKEPLANAGSPDVDFRHLAVWHLGPRRIAGLRALSGTWAGMQ
jgi:hypothetical protein